MKYEEYERPELEEIEIQIEGSFLNSSTSNSDFEDKEKPGFGIDDDEYDGDF